MASFLTVISEAIGQPSANQTLAIIFRQMLDDRNISTTDFYIRMDNLIAEMHPDRDVAIVRANLQPRLAADVLSWADFVIAMKIIGATEISVTVT